MKFLIKKLIRRAGFELTRLTPKSNPYKQIFTSLSHFGVNQILDIGANKGQFAREMRAVGYQGRIVSFEPLSSAYHMLVKQANSDDNWIVHDRCAIGSMQGKKEIHISENSVSSSMLRILDAHTQAAPQSKIIGTETVNVTTLNDVCSHYIHSDVTTMVKIDAQGYEWDILDGASEILDSITGLIVEVSLVPLYENQHLWLDVINRLQKHGFTLWHINQGFRDMSNGRTLQMDIAFYRI